MTIGPRCALCKKQRQHHRASDKACPIGDVRRCTWNEKQVFTPREPRKKEGSEKRKDRVTRRAVKADPCCACLRSGTDWNPVDPAHIRTFKVTQSDHPDNFIPLCRECHQLQHKEGWKTFIATRPNVGWKIQEQRWVFHLDPFNENRLILTHPEIA